MFILKVKSTSPIHEAQELTLRDHLLRSAAVKELNVDSRAEAQLPATSPDNHFLLFYKRETTIGKRECFEFVKSLQDVS